MCAGDENGILYRAARFDRQSRRRRADQYRKAAGAASGMGFFMSAMLLFPVHRDSQDRVHTIEDGRTAVQPVLPAVPQILDDLPR